MSDLGDRCAAAEVIEAELVRVRLPLRTPHRAAHGSEAEREVVLVRVRLADGGEGWGECSALARPTYTAEHVSGAWTVLRDELLPARLAARPAGVVGHPMAAAAVEVAVADAVLGPTGRSLAAALAEPWGGHPATAVQRCAVLGLDGGPDRALERVAALLAVGVAMVKCKVTPREEDLAPVAVIRTAWPDLPLAVDFNGTADAAALGRLDPLGLAYVEQPAPADDLVASARLAARLEAPVALDESVIGLGSLDAIAELRAGAVVNVKPARCGGPLGAVAVVERARSLGLRWFVGGMLETGVGRAAALAVAALPDGALPTDLGPSDAYFDLDLTEPIELDGQGHVLVPTGPGIGVRPDRDRLEAAVVDRLALRR